MSYTPVFFASGLSVEPVAEKKNVFIVRHYSRPVDYAFLSAYKKADAVTILTNIFYGLDKFLIRSEGRHITEIGNVFFNPRTAKLYSLGDTRLDNDRYFSYTGRENRTYYADRRVFAACVALQSYITAFRAFTRLYHAKDGTDYRILKGIDYECLHCGENVLEHASFIIVAQDGTLFCGEDCAVEAGYSLCDDCGIWTDRALETSDGNTICYDCYEESYATCDNCGAIIRESDALDINDHRFCNEDCARDFGYGRCSECGELVYENALIYDDSSEEYLCRSCYDARNVRIHDYGYKPAPVFFRHDTDTPGKTLYFGSEIETAFDSRSDREYAIDEIYGKPALVSTTYLKHDASLPSGRSFEAVTHPLSLDYIHNNLNVFSDFFDAVSERDKDEIRCGGHIHISRRGITEEHETALELFFFKYSAELEKIAGRSMNGYCNPIVKEKLEKGNEYLAEHCDYSRYRALNWQNADTVEIRIFAVPKTWGEWIANVEFAHGLYQYTKSRKFDGVLSENFLDFLAFMAENIERYPYFGAYKAPLFI